MKKITILLVVVILLSMILVSATAAAPKEPKVFVCHHTGRNSFPVFQLIEISAKAVDAHLAHDDFLAIEVLVEPDVWEWVCPELPDPPPPPPIP